MGVVCKAYYPHRKNKPRCRCPFLSFSSPFAFIFLISLLRKEIIGISELTQADALLVDAISQAPQRRQSGINTMTEGYPASVMVYS